MGRVYQLLRELLFSVPLDPPLQPYPILLEQEGSGPEALSEDPVRFGIARGAADPLRSNFVLRGGEPALRENLHQPGMEIEHEECHGRIVSALGRVSGGNNQFLDIS